MNPTRSLFLIVSALLLFSACTGPLGGQEPTQRREGEEEEEPPERLPTPRDRNMAAYEDFDVAPYREEAPVTEVEFEHDVPPRLLENRADEGVEQTVQGFRIQVFSTQDKTAADETVEEAIDWWSNAREDAPEGILPEQLPIDIRYRQPYYRVRLGNFVSRTEAERALQYVRRRFPDAFIAPDTVTITR